MSSAEDGLDAPTETPNTVEQPKRGGGEIDEITEVLL